ncbi:MAG: hypothetical protein EHM70_00540 [Chloroflexota bacterium]|nr:MAG: hypothetical protein EHM70_00540 [Chloroflexota bacterium]
MNATAPPETVIPDPPSLMASLMAGFDAITRHISLILFPLALDLLLWFGPHVKAIRLIENLANQMVSLRMVDEASSAEWVQANKEMWSLIAERLNFMIAMRTYPVGIPSLMASRFPIKMPGGNLPAVVEMASFGEVAFWVMVFTLVGLLAGTIYFIVVADAAVSGQVHWMQALRRWPKASLQVLLLTLFWGLLLFGASIPASCVTSALLIGSPTWGRFALLLYGGVILWLIFPLLFSSHGIVVSRYGVVASVKRGMRITRMTLPTTSLLFLVILLLSEGLDVFWKIPAEDSWLTVVAVLGHAFVTTGLLAASFVYYHEADRWTQTVLSRWKQPPVQFKA